MKNFRIFYLVLFMFFINFSCSNNQAIIIEKTTKSFNVLFEENTEINTALNYSIADFTLVVLGEVTDYEWGQTENKLYYRFSGSSWFAWDLDNNDDLEEINVLPKPILNIDYPDIEEPEIIFNSPNNNNAIFVYSQNEDKDSESWHVWGWDNKSKERFFLGEIGNCLDTEAVWSNNENKVFLYKGRCEIEGYDTVTQIWLVDFDQHIISSMQNTHSLFNNTIGYISYSPNDALLALYDSKSNQYVVTFIDDETTVFDLVSDDIYVRGVVGWLTDDLLLVTYSLCKSCTSNLYFGVYDLMSEEMYELGHKEDYPYDDKQESMFFFSLSSDKSKISFLIGDSPFDISGLWIVELTTNTP